MRDINRIDNILAEIKNIWKSYPDLRLGQIIASSANYGVIYYAEDDQLLDLIKQTFPVKEVLVEVVKEEPAKVEEPIIEVKEEEPEEKEPSYIYMHRGSVVKRVPTDKVDEWLHLGYEKGRK